MRCVFADSRLYVVLRKALRAGMSLHRQEEPVSIALLQGRHQYVLHQLLYT